MFCYLLLAHVLLNMNNVVRVYIDYAKAKKVFLRNANKLAKNFWLASLFYS